MACIVHDNSDALARPWLEDGSQIDGHEGVETWLFQEDSQSQDAPSLSLSIVYLHHFFFLSFT
jgi:hypothetical protein